MDAKLTRIVSRIAGWNLQKMGELNARVQPRFGGVFVAGAYYGPRSKPIVINARL